MRYIIKRNCKKNLKKMEKQVPKMAFQALNTSIKKQIGRDYATVK
jgi:hypothetical protein